MTDVAAALGLTVYSSHIVKVKSKVEIYDSVEVHAKSDDSALVTSKVAVGGTSVNDREFEKFITEVSIVPTG